MLSTASSTFSFPQSLLRESYRLDLPLPVLKVLSYEMPGQLGQSHEIVDSLEPVIRALDTRVHWFSVCGEQGKLKDHHNFSVHTLNPPLALLNNSANFCNHYLAPLFHGRPANTAFDVYAWKSFRQLSELVAAQVLDVSSDSFPILFWQHDYQLALTAPLLAMQTGSVLAHFWHSPWPLPQHLLSFPAAEEFVEAMLSNNLLCFQNEESAQNFLKTVEIIVPRAKLDKKTMTIDSMGTVTKIKVMPLGMDSPRWQMLAERNKLASQNIRAQYGQRGQIILGIDRIDPDWGILEKLAGLADCWATNHKQLPPFQYVQIIYDVNASGTGVDARSAEYLALIKARVEALNKKYGQDGYCPTILIEGRLTQQELSAWYQAADILFINSLSSGHSLIGKEFISSRDDEQAVLILSKNCGIASELKNGALLVDPNNRQQISKILNRALKMTNEEKRERMTKLRQIVRGNQLQDWALNFLKEGLALIPRTAGTTASE